MTRHTIQWLGLLAGPVLAVIAYLLLPDSYAGPTGEQVAFSATGKATLAIMVWMGTWWLTEAIHISATALLPIVVFPLLGLSTIRDTTSAYGDPLIFLFFGGFVLALSMQRWGLDRRIALRTLRVVGTKPINMVGGFMLVTAMLSAFVSNTATTAMMLPIAMSVIALVDGTRTSSDASDDAGPKTNFALCLMLGLAYAASIGGTATIIGSPPNGFLVGFLNDRIDEAHRTEISFFQWMTIGVPLAVVFLPITWLLLTRVLYPIRVREVEGGREMIDRQLRELGPVKRGEWATLIVFCCTATLWIFRSALTEIEFTIGDRTLAPFGTLTDTGIAMLAALALFVIPVDVKTRTMVLDWRTAERLPWGILILFGGGLALAAAVGSNGVAEYFGSLAGQFAGWPALLVVAIVAIGIIFLTELTSNTATAATLIPILAALAAGMGIHPYLLIFPAAFAASCAFMMPVATPPNAIVFGSGEVTIPQMVKAGLWLNLLGVVLITLLTMLLIQPLLGLA